MTQGTHNHSRLVSIVDLDELLAQRSLAPIPVKLGGTTYQVRTDLTAVEANNFLTLMRKQLDAQAFTILVGTKAERAALTKAIKLSEAGQEVDLPSGKLASKLDEYIDGLPQIHQALASSRIMHATKVLAQYAMSEADVLAKYGYDLETETSAESEKTEQGESSAS